MSEKENIQLVEQMLAALNARDLDRYAQSIDSSYVGESELAPTPAHGPSGARQMLNMLLTAFPDLRIEVEQTLASGDYVVVRARLIGTHKGTYAGVAPTNKSVMWRGCNVVEIRNGKAIKSRVYADNASLLQQLGAISIPRATAAG
jgi:steroid delta-isomerase-like uncharacterized protein